MSSKPNFDPGAARPMGDFIDPFSHDPSVERTITPLWKEAKWAWSGRSYDSAESITAME